MYFNWSTIFEAKQWKTETHSQRTTTQSKLFNQSSRTKKFMKFNASKFKQIILNNGLKM